MDAINGQMKFLREGIKHNDETIIIQRINLLKKRTLLLIAESIQTVPMIEKFINSLE